MLCSGFSYPLCSEGDAGNIVGLRPEDVENEEQPGLVSDVT